MKADERWRYLYGLHYPGRAVPDPGKPGLLPIHFIERS